MTNLSYRYCFKCILWLRELWEVEGGSFHGSCQSSIHKKMYYLACKLTTGKLPSIRADDQMIRTQLSALQLPAKFIQGFTFSPQTFTVPLCACHTLFCTRTQWFGDFGEKSPGQVHSRPTWKLFQHILKAATGDFTGDDRSPRRGS